MKIVTINGSVNSDGNTAYLLDTIRNYFKEKGYQTDSFSLGKENISGCLACGKCRDIKKCVIEKDSVNNIFRCMTESDAIIIGSPVYYADITANTKALIERIGNLTRANNNVLAKKIGSAVISVRRGGAIHSFNSINHLFLISQMIIVGSHYWNMSVGDASSDEEGIKNMLNLSENIDWLLQKINQTQ